MCDPEYESLQGVSSCCTKTHRRAYHVTPDLRWHGQQLPYSSLYVSTDYSTSVDGILPHKLPWRLYLFHYACLRPDCCRGGVHTVQQKHAPSYIHHTYNVLVSMNNVLFSGSGTQSRQKNQSNYPGFQIMLPRTEIRVNYLFSIDGDTKNNV